MLQPVLHFKHKKTSGKQDPPPFPYLTSLYHPGKDTKSAWLEEKVREEGCIRSSSPLPHSCATLLYHRFPTAVWRYFKRPPRSSCCSWSAGCWRCPWPITAPPQLAQESSPWPRVMSLGTTPPLLGGVWGSSGAEAGRTVEHCNISTPDKTCTGFVRILDTSTSSYSLPTGDQQTPCMAAAGLTG